MKAEEFRDALKAQVSPGAAALIDRRHAAAVEICSEKGWTLDDLTIEQIVEIRQDSRWRAA